MSHSDNKILPEIWLLQKDLKGYTRNQLFSLARYYNISTNINRERLTMEIARKNFSLHKARFESGTNDMNKRILKSEKYNCSQKINQLQKTVETKINALNNKQDTVYKQLESVLDKDPEQFQTLSNNVFRTCQQELDSVPKQDLQFQ